MELKVKAWQGVERNDIGAVPLEHQEWNTRNGKVEHTWKGAADMEWSCKNGME